MAFEFPPNGSKASIALSSEASDKRIPVGNEAASTRVSDLTAAWFPELPWKRRKRKIRTPKVARGHTTMNPAHSILDDSFRYVPAVATSVAETWRRFGWRPTSEEERKKWRRPTAISVVESVPAVTPIRRTAPTAAVES